MPNKSPSGTTDLVLETRILKEYLATEFTEVTETSLRIFSFRNEDLRILGFRGFSFRNKDFRNRFSKQGFKDYRIWRNSSLKFR